MGSCFRVTPQDSPPTRTALGVAMPREKLESQGYKRCHQLAGCNSPPYGSESDEQARPKRKQFARVSVAYQGTLLKGGIWESNQRKRLAAPLLSAFNITPPNQKGDVWYVVGSACSPQSRWAKSPPPPASAAPRSAH